jgi:hypothetical protein
MHWDKAGLASRLPRSKTRATGRQTGRAAALLGVLLASVIACGRQDTAEPGSAAGTPEPPANPQSAPDVQPQYRQGDGATTSRVITNALGQRGLSLNETNAPNAATGQGADSDQALAQKVRVALSTGTTGTTGTYSTDTLLTIGVTAENGLITLTGEVGSQSSRTALEERAKSIQGVKSVRNELRVSPNAAEPTPGAPAGRGQVETVPQNPRE